MHASLTAYNTDENDGGSWCAHDFIFTTQSSSLLQLPRSAACVNAPPLPLSISLHADLFYNWADTEDCTSVHAGCSSDFPGDYSAYLQERLVAVDKKSLANLKLVPTCSPHTKLKLMLMSSPRTHQVEVHMPCAPRTHAGDWLLMSFARRSDDGAAAYTARQRAAALSPVWGSTNHWDIKGVRYLMDYTLTGMH